MWPIVYCVEMKKAYKKVLLKSSYMTELQGLPVGKQLGFSQVAPMFDRMTSTYTGSGKHAEAERKWNQRQITVRLGAGSAREKVENKNADKLGDDRTPQVVGRCWGELVHS